MVAVFLSHLPSQVHSEQVVLIIFPIAQWGKKGGNDTVSAALRIPSVGTFLFFPGLSPYHRLVLHQMHFLLLGMFLNCH